MTSRPVGQVGHCFLVVFKKLLDLFKNSVSFVSLWLSLHFCVCLVVLTVVTMNDAAVFLLQRDNFHSNYSINSV